MITRSYFGLSPIKSNTYLHASLAPFLFLEKDESFSTPSSINFLVSSSDPKTGKDKNIYNQHLGEVPYQINYVNHKIECHEIF